MSGERKVIVDVDVGTDDAWALLLLLKCEKRFKIKVEAVTCVYGNTDIDNVARNVVRILTAINRCDVPVYKGASEELISPAPARLSHFHGHDGFGDLDFGELPNSDLVRKEHAVNILHKHISENPKEISLIFVGPLTNLALCLKMYPDVRSKIKDLFIMGGNRHGVGNATRAAEFNFYADPEAANIVFKSVTCPITVLPWETCIVQQQSLSMEWRLNVLGDTQNKAVQMLNLIEKKCYQEWKHWMPCDAFLAAVFVVPDIVEEAKRYHVDIELNGRFTRGQMVLDHLSENEENTIVVDRINADTFKNLMLYCADHVVEEFS